MSDRRPALGEALRRLRAQGLLTGEPAARLERIADGRLLSVRAELQALLWAGVTLIAAGAGLLLKENLARLGPLAIGGGIGAAAALCLWHVARTAPAFARGPVPSPTLAFDYVLLLGVLLLGSDLAWLETQVRLFGPAWPWHLLLLSLIQLALAFRYDSRAVLSLALASFAAWRGLSLSLSAGGLFERHADALRLNALAVGALFLASGSLLRRRALKAHFEPAFGNLGLLLLLGAAVSGSFGGQRGVEWAWLAALALLAGAVVGVAFRAGRSDYFAQGVIAAYLAFLRLAAELRSGTGLVYLVCIGSFAVLSLILWAHRRFRGRP